MAAPHDAALQHLVRGGLIPPLAPLSSDVLSPASSPTLFPALVSFIRDQAIAALDRPASSSSTPKVPSTGSATPQKVYDAEFPPLAPRPASTSSAPKRVAPTKVHALCTNPEDLAAQTPNATALRSLAALYASLFDGKHLPSIASNSYFFFFFHCQILQVCLTY